MDESRDLCRICGGSAGARFDVHGFSWLRCANCKSVTKLLTRAQYDALNPTYDPGAFLKSRSRDEILDFLRIDDKTKIIRDTLAGWWNGDPSKASFLDVGSGMGGYLIAARDLGFDVLGFEPSVEHSEVARDIFDLPVVADYFSPEKLDGRKFDFAILSHVIEHIYDPAPFVKSLLSVLNPGGVLVIITPNTQSFTARLCGTRWPMLRPIDHVSLISSRAYRHFALPEGVAVHHRWSEFPYEFAATLASVLRDGLRGRRGAAPVTNDGVAFSAETGVTRARIRLPLLLQALAVISFPAHLLAKATGRQAALVTTLVMTR